MLFAFNTTKETERNKGTKQQNNNFIFEDDNSARSAETKHHSQFVLIETGDESSTRIGETKGHCKIMRSEDMHVSSKAILNDNFENRCIRDSRDSSITCNENLEKLLKLAESEEVQKFHDMLAFSEDVKAFHSILSCIAMKQENSPPELRK